MLKTASGIEDDPITSVYRVVVEEKATEVKEIRTIVAANPDAALDRIMDMLTGGLLTPDEFWDKYKVINIHKEL